MNKFNEQLTQAVQMMDLCLSHIREAHTYAVHSDNEFSEIVMFGILEQASKLEQSLQRAAGAADRQEVKP